MKILELNLTAFGPFSGTQLYFTGGPAGFHMVYGANEAGKSSALRALRSMLFGIPAQTADNFHHAYGQLRIGARLMKYDGAEIAFIRRKGKAKTLRGPNDNEILDDNALVPFLGGVDQQLFEQMFAIGHEDLVTGGQEIISGGGNVGQALFAAGAGLIHLQSVQQQMLQDCETLFKPTGTKPAINGILSTLNNTRKEQREVLLSAKTWKTHHQGLLKAQKEREETQKHLDALKKQSSRLGRLRDGMPFLSRKKEIDATLLAYDGVPDLPPNFGDDRRTAESDLKLAKNDLLRADEEWKAVTTRLKALEVPEILIHNAGAIESLQPELGIYRKATADRPTLDAKMQSLQKQAAANLSDISEEMRSDTSAGVKLPAGVVADIQELGKTVERLTIKRESAVGQQGKLDASMGNLIKQKAELPARTGAAHLKSALEDAQRAGPLEKQLAERLQSIGDLEESLNRDLQRQTVWAGRLEAVDALPCPSAETIEQYREAMQKAVVQLEKLNSDKYATHTEIDRISGELKTIAQTVDVPLEADLSTARDVRDEGWRLVRQELDGNAPPPEMTERFTTRFDLPAPALPDAFEKSIAQTDHISDRLRREAAQVNRKASLEGQLHLFETRKNKCENAIQSASGAIEDLSVQWRSQWQKAGITPLSPTEMQSWLAGIQAVREKLADLRIRRAKAETLRSETDSLRTRLTETLIAEGQPVQGSASLSQLIALAAERVAAKEKTAARHESIENELAQVSMDQSEVTATLAKLDVDLSTWQTAWREKVIAIGLDEDTSPPAATAVIERIKTAKNQLAEANEFKKRINGIDRDAANFKTRVAALVTAIAPDLGAEHCENAVEILQSRLTAARSTQTTQKSLLERLNKAEEDKKDAEQRLARAETLIGTLCREAGCDRSADMTAVENRSTAKWRLLEELKTTEQHLRHFSGGATIEAFITEAESVDVDAIEPALERIADDIVSLEESRSKLDVTIGDIQNELKRMDGSAKAAELAQTAERLLGNLESGVEHFARLKMASVLLARTIEQYRKKYQGPLVSRASELFAQMTAGAFSAIRPDYNDKGHPMLVGVRPNSGQQVAVDGMSDGTADQLYLALRLASLEQYLAHNEPLPFIVDDILLRFDDARATATLNVLAELSEKTQVIFFTHHRHLVDLAKDQVKHPGIAFHEL